MKQLLLLCCLFTATDLFAQNVGIGNPNPQEMLSVAGGIQAGYTTTNNGGTVRFNGTGMDYNTGFGWRSLVNYYLDSSLSTLTPFSTTTRNSFITIPGVSLTIPDTGVYLIIYKVYGYDNDQYSPSGGNYDNSGTVNFMLNSSSIATRQFLITDLSGNPHDNTAQINLNSNPVEYSTVLFLNKGNVLTIKAEVGAVGSTPDPWTISEADITTVRLY